MPIFYARSEAAENWSMEPQVFLGRLNEHVRRTIVAVDTVYWASTIIVFLGHMTQADHEAAR